MFSRRIFTRLGHVLARAASWVLGWAVPKDSRLLVVGGRYFGGNTAPVFERAEHHGLGAYWLTTRAEILALGHPRIVSARSWRGIWLGARAGRVAFTHTLSDFSPLRFPHPAVRLFNIWHGMPLRRVSTQDPDFLARSHAKSNMREMKRYAGMFVTSTAMKDVFRITFGLPPEKIHITGQPRTDRLLRREFPPIDHLFEPRLPAGHRKVLYCPTWREHKSVQLFPFRDLDHAVLQETLEKLDAVIYVRTHPNDPGQWPRRDGRIVPFQRDIVPEITDVLGHFQALITDYSSVFYDFLLLDRPTIFLPYDLETYSVRPGFYLPFESLAAGPRPATQVDFLRELGQALRFPDRYADERRRVSELIYRYRDDGATDRTLSVIVTSGATSGRTQRSKREGAVAK